MATEDERPRSFDEFELRLGDVMRGERATLGKSLLDVRRELRIKTSYVAAIENSDSATFENPSFVAGHVRSYARYLGIDPEWALHQFCLEADFTPPSGLPAIAAPGAKSAAMRMKPKLENLDRLGGPKAFFIPHSPSLVSAVEPVAVGSILAVLVLIGGLGYGGWSVLSAFQQIQILPADQTPMMTDSVYAMRGVSNVPKFSTAGLVANVSAAKPSAVALRRIYQSSAPEVPVLAPHDEPIAEIDPDPIDLTLAPTRGKDIVAPIVSRAFARNTDPAYHAEKLASSSPVRLWVDPPSITDLGFALTVSSQSSLRGSK